MIPGTGSTRIYDTENCVVSAGVLVLPGTGRVVPSNYRIPTFNANCIAVYRSLLTYLRRYLLISTISVLTIMQSEPQKRRTLSTKQTSMGPDIDPDVVTNNSNNVISPISNNKTTLREVKSLSLDIESNHNHKNIENADNIHDDHEEDETAPLDSMDRDDHRGYQKAKRQRRIKLWKESPFAIGLTEPTWIDERNKSVYSYSDSRSNDMMPDESGCLCMSAQICPLLGASRVGNMAVLKTSQEWVEEMEIDEETNEQSLRRYTRPRLDIVVGPYWPMLCFVTYPLILGVSGWAFISVIIRPGTSIVLRFVWFVCTMTLIIALGRTAFRDPGILYRQRSQKDATWRWSDQADTYRPRHAWFDMDTAVVIEGFDHTYVFWKHMHILVTSLSIS